MQLIIGGDKLDGEVTNGLIEQSIRGLTQEADSFAILEKSHMYYIQTAGDPKNGFVLEYQDGSLEEHFSCTDGHIDTNKVIKAFQSYLAQDRRWLQDFNWEKESLASGGSKSAGLVVAVVGIVVIIGAMILWQSA